MTSLPARPAHPRSANSTRRGGLRAPLTPVADAQNAPHTLAPGGVTPGPRAARGIILYVGLDEAKAAEDGTNLAAVAQELQRYANELASRAETQAVIALAPEGPGRDIDAVRAVVSGSPAATGKPAGAHGPVRSRIPTRVQAPALRPQQDPAAGLLVDAPRREVHIDGAPVSLTHKEFDLLTYLIAHEGETISRETLIEALWSDSPEGEAPTVRTIDVHIRRLRGRLGTYSSVVRTIRGGGYRYDTHPDVTFWKATARSV